MGNAWKLGCQKKDGKGIWKSNTTNNGWSGPCVWRPTNSGCNRPDEERMKMCFDHFDENGNIVLKTGGKDPKNVCTNVTFDADRIQHGGVPNVNTGTQSCGNELTFALTYEVNFMNDFQLDEEFKLHGCGGSYEGDTLWQGDSTIDCPHNMERYENGEALSEMTTAFGEDHDVWNEEFMVAWEKMIVNGYADDGLVDGPQYSLSLIHI